MQFRYIVYTKVIKYLAKNPPPIFRNKYAEKCENNSILPLFMLAYAVKFIIQQMEITPKNMPKYFCGRFLSRIARPFFTV